MLSGSIDICAGSSIACTRRGDVPSFTLAALHSIILMTMLALYFYMNVICILALIIIAIEPAAPLAAPGKVFKTSLRSSGGVHSTLGHKTGHAEGVEVLVENDVVNTQENVFDLPIASNGQNTHGMMRVLLNLGVALPVFVLCTASL